MKHTKPELCRASGRQKLRGEIITALISLFLIFGHAAHAQDMPFRINGMDVKEYLIEKYNLRKHNVSSTLQQTPNGPKGYLSISGMGIKPKFMPVEENIQARARAIAKAFLKEEARLFGITNMDEIREISVETDICSVESRKRLGI